MNMYPRTAIAILLCSVLFGGAVFSAGATTGTFQVDDLRLVKLAADSTVQGTLDQDTAFRVYWFAGQQGAQVTVSPEVLPDFQPVFVLYDSAFTELIRAEAGESLQTVLPGNGIYFLVVGLPTADSIGGAYALTMNLGSNPAAQADVIDIAYGSSQRGTLDGMSWETSYRFRGSAGDTVTVTMSRAGGDLNSYLFLLDENGQVLYEDDDSGGENGNARMTYTLPADGSYLIQATRFGQEQGTTSGSYLLELFSDSPPPAEPAEPDIPAEYAGLPKISIGETVEATLSDARYMDVYVFNGTAGDSIVIEMESLNKGESNALDPLLILLDAQRVPLAEHDDIVDGQERDSRIEFVLPETGYYAIVATRFEQAEGASSGPYALMLRPGADDVGGDDTGDVSAADVGAAPLEQLDAEPLAVDEPMQHTGFGLYTFTASGGKSITLQAEDGDTVLILADAGLNEIDASSAGVLSGVVLPETGQYLAIAAPLLGPAGDDQPATLALSIGDDSVDDVPDGPTPVVYGETVTGVINDQIPSRLYTFEGAAGDQVQIVMEAVEGSDLDCYLELQDENGVVIDANDDIVPGDNRNSEIVTELPADGRYLVIVSRYVGPDVGLTSGGYRLTLGQGEVLGADGDGVSAAPVLLTYGETATGEITDDQYLTFFVFDGSAGDAVTISIEHLSGNLDSVLYLYQAIDDGWMQIATNDDSPTGGTYEALLSDIILPQTGRYLVAVSRYGLEFEDTSGTFAITLTLEP